MVLDACGAGATAFRDEKCAEILGAVRVDIIKGNSSEIARIAGERVATKGVDAAGMQERKPRPLAEGLAESRGCTVVVTGPQDIVAGCGHSYIIKNGHPMMACIVGTGCMAFR